MRIGEVAERAGVNLETLRYYERRGLLSVPPRTSSGYRDYPPEAVRLVRFIKRAQSLGFGLEEVAELLELADGGPDDPGLLRARVAAVQARMEAKRLDLVALRDGLQRFADSCRDGPPEGCASFGLSARFRERR